MFLVHKYMELSLPLILFITPTLIKRKHKFIEVGYVKEIKSGMWILCTLQIKPARNILNI